MLSKASEERVLLYIIRRPRDPKERISVILPLGWKTYSRHWSVHVRLAVLERDDCPDEITQCMSKYDPDPKVRRLALQRIHFKQKGIFLVDTTFLENFAAPT